ncbi:hypothetical protein L2E82_42615 [Cichorium intybus]|uniref:Uncharacterized protein n=1 Tax=Cichorium intybus TaxID=13427 RepID=A0ACB8ZLE4_CICIN|nr:hypothetical protein L2E82_42615 [Cichorium intybus]
MKPYACDPSSLPKYQHSKEIDAKRNAGGRIRASGGSRNVRRGLQTTLSKVVQVEARRTSYLNVSTGSIDNLVTVTTTSQDVRSFEPIYEQDLSFMMQSYDLKKGKMKLQATN